jgi:hypothetical protein
MIKIPINFPLIIINSVTDFLIYEVQNITEKSSWRSPAAAALSEIFL